MSDAPGDGAAAPSAPVLLPATPQLVVPRLRAVLQDNPAARFVGFAAARWSGGDAVEVDGHRLPVVWAEGPLAVREALRRPVEGPTVIVTGAGEAVLGEDVLARLERQRLLPIDRWRTVADLFGALTLDRRVAAHPELVTALMDLAPATGYKPVASGVLDVDTAWRGLLHVVVGVDDPGDLVALLQQVRTPEAWGAWTGLAAPLRAEALSWLRAREGRAPAAVLATLEVPADRAVDPVAVGLVAGIVLADPADHRPVAPEEATALAVAAGRLAHLVDGLAVGDHAAQLWADAAAEVCDQLRMGAQPAFQTAERLLADVGAAGHVDRSPVLPSGHDQRLRLAAAALEAVLDAPAEGAVGTALTDLWVAVEAVAAHRSPSPARLRALRMASRLARRLDAPGVSPASFDAAAAHYVDDGGWADLAYAWTWAAETEPDLVHAYQRLLALVGDRRTAEDRRFAELLVDWVAAGKPGRSAAPGGPAGAGARGLVYVEDVLDTVVAPLVEAGCPVLLLVLDGMSVAAAAELFPSLGEEGWMEVAPAGSPPFVAVPPFPTVTRVARTSLFAGSLVEGDARAEKEAFARHPRLSALSVRGREPVVFHKSDLSGPAGSTLDDDVTAALQEPDQRVVAVVVNAIDDHLTKGSQVAVPWTTENIAPLAALLRLAAAAGRAVVVTADHGHVVERGTAFQGTGATAGGAGERWRPAGPSSPPPREDEIVLAGPRVLDGDGRIVVPWSDGLRYGPRKHGYHGGASPAEVVVPVGVFVTSEFAGWEDVPPRRPEWWDVEAPIPVSVPGTEAPRVTVPKPSRKRARKPSSPSEAGQLFPVEAEPEVEPAVPEVAEARAAAGWVDELLAGATYAQQEQRAGRGALGRERVARILTALDARGGTMTTTALARTTDIPPHRLDGVVAALARLLNVDGFPAVVVDEGSVRLDLAVLAQQFGLRSPGSPGSAGSPPS